MDDDVLDKHLEYSEEEVEEEKKKDMRKKQRKVVGNDESNTLRDKDVTDRRNTID